MCGNIRTFPVFFFNTALVSVASTLISAIIASFAAYGFSRFNFRGSKTVQYLFLFTQMVPAILLLMPYFIMMSKLNLINTHIALIVAFISFSLPFCTWMLKASLTRSQKS